MSAWTDAADEDTLAAEHAHEAEAARVLRAGEDSLRLVTEQRDEALAEADNLRNHLRAMHGDVARADALAIILDGAREGLARSGSKARAVQQVADGLRAQVVRDAVEAQRDRTSRAAGEDRGRAASQALTVAALERDLREVRAELARVIQERDDAQVRALREAAGVWEEGVEYGATFNIGVEAICDAQEVLRWLRARADEIEGEGR